MKIHELCEDERPREKMIAAGPSALSNPELLAVLLRGGTPQDNVLEVARKLLSLADGSLTRLFNMTGDRMRTVSGIGPCKAATLQAAMELGRRFMTETSGVRKKAIVSARMVFDLMIPRLKGAGYEECWILFLNAHNYLIGKEMLSSGGTTSTTFDVGKAIRMSLDRNATGIILTHNHPTGNPHPSREDLKQTEALHKACSAVGISLLDHVIVSDDCFFSCADDRLYQR